MPLAPLDADRCVLALFAKWPTAGQVKTRLAAASSAQWACRAAEAMLRDAIGRWSEVAVRRVLAFAPSEAEAAFRSLVRDRLELLPQGPGDLGQRLARLVAHLLAAGAERLVVLGTDSPTLPRAIVEQAFTELRTADVVLGPATDGGYYLLGCRRLPPIFDGIPWSTAQVLGETVKRLQAADMRLALLPPWYDVDTLEDWQTLRGHLAALQLAGIEPDLPHVSALEDP